jgi:hypothetical protein
MLCVRVHPILALGDCASGIVVFGLAGAARCGRGAGGSSGGCSGRGCGSRCRGHLRGRRRSWRGSWSGCRGRRCCWCCGGCHAAVLRARAATGLGGRAIRAGHHRARLGARLRGLLRGGRGLLVHASVAGAGAAARGGRGGSIGTDRRRRCLCSRRLRDATKSGECRGDEQKTHTHRESPERENARVPGNVRQARERGIATRIILLQRDGNRTSAKNSLRTRIRC